jgi:hypothetical protein
MYTVWHVDKYKITFKLVIDHWSQGPVPGRGLEVEKHCSKWYPTTTQKTSISTFTTVKTTALGCFCPCYKIMHFILQVSALLGRIPSAVGYQPTLATDMGTMQERITTTKKGSITSVQVHVHYARTVSWKVINKNPLCHLASPYHYY